MWSRRFAAAAPVRREPVMTRRRRDGTLVGLEALAATLAQQGRAGESRQVYARAAEAFETVGDPGAADRCRDSAAAAP
ncbi:hypothetical protein ACFFX1_50570 [Dactylosporangium sucinum]|uniref:Uncharacterized protein n=1 Tax=Dactylosporangium sucinum TaxID=1424081 RepID=A0A917TY31_9ACTN|nr:hypothetical protein [Dactylosporangium sucinum]GGM43323.1 hypothetical protein GCM10007977_051070 [Dactylosporangium sucinum]